MSENDDDFATAANSPRARGADTAIDGLDPWQSEVEGGAVSESARVVDARPRQLEVVGYAERYQTKRQLGVGGMGEVNLCFDTLTGRDVAVKVMLEEIKGRHRFEERFLREARVQAQLEHPGVVPVYDLGVTPGGQPYFAMKRVNGITLFEVIRGLAEGDPETVARYPRPARLSLLARVCETVAYAHARGVVHRDLKPANVMLGDFGEVNVLDWGIAKLRSDTDLTGPGTDPDEDEPEFTVPGAVVGTAGYMAPEQATGDEIDPSADVYALGAMLFEVVTLERLNPGQTRTERLRVMMNGPDARPSQRVDDVPIELDAICVRATATLRKDRYGSAGEMLRDLRAYVDGQAASELRREVAGRHAQAARLSLASVGSSETVRVRALRDLGAAAVLDPGNQEMIEMIETLLLPEGHVPEDVELEIESLRRTAASRAAGRSAIAYAAALVIFPILAWMGVRDWPVFCVLAAALVLSAAGALFMWRSGRSTGAAAWLAVPFAFSSVGVMGAIFGPFFLVPALVAMVSVAFTVSVRAEIGLRRVILACGCTAVLLPAGLQWMGVLPPSLSFSEGSVQLLPRLASFPEAPTTLFLLITSLFVIIVSNVLVGRAVESLSVAERRLLVQAHRLRAMLPQRNDA